MQQLKQQIIPMNLLLELSIKKIFDINFQFILKFIDKGFDIPIHIISNDLEFITIYVVEHDPYCKNIVQSMLSLFNHFFLIVAIETSNNEFRLQKIYESFFIKNINQEITLLNKICESKIYLLIQITTQHQFKISFN